MKIQVCLGKTCKSRFSDYILNRLENDKKFHKLKNLEIASCLCTGNCKIGPTVVFDEDIETAMNPSKASKIMINKIKKD